MLGRVGSRRLLLHPCHKTQVDSHARSLCGTECWNAVGVTFGGHKVSPLPTDMVTQPCHSPVSIGDLSNVLLVVYAANTTRPICCGSLSVYTLRESIHGVKVAM